MVHLMDTDRSFEAPYNRDGWPFLMLVDPNGVIVHRANNLIDREPQIIRTLQRMKAAPDAPPIVTVDGTPYSTETLRRSNEPDRHRLEECFPHLAAGPDGRVFLVFTAVRDGNSGVWLRIWDGNAWSEDRPVAASGADEYDGTVSVSPQGQAWFCWTSNAGADIYDIFATSLDRLTAGREPIRITQSDDDAMAARMAWDAAGTLWITYYRWQLNAQGISRDKEVFVRTLRDDTLSREVQVSPTDVPSYEDHTDPTIAALGDKMLICWSWDYHQPKGYTREAETPTLFLSAIDAGLKPARPFHLSGRNIDMVPVLAAHGDAAWCAWDSLAASRSRRSKTLFVRRVSASGCLGEPVALATDLEHLCSPSFALGPQGQAVLVWSQKKRGGDWQLQRADADARGRWSAPQTLSAEANPRYPCAVFDTTGCLCLAYTADTDQGRQIKAAQLK